MEMFIRQQKGDARTGAYLLPRVKRVQNRHLPPLLRFIPQFAQICIIFALSKFEANPFFRPVFVPEGNFVFYALTK